MSASGNQFWPILTESACAMQDFEKKSKSNHPNPHTDRYTDMCIYRAPMELKISVSQQEPTLSLNQRRY